MDNLVELIEELTEEGTYYGEVVDELAEVYLVGDPTPIVFIEYMDDIFLVSIRRDLPPKIVANVIYEITTIEEDIIIGNEFLPHPEDGMLFGTEATEFHHDMIHDKLEQQQLDEVTYVVEYPIYAYGYKNKENKMQRLWNDNLE